MNISRIRRFGAITFLFMYLVLVVGDNISADDALILGICVMFVSLSLIWFAMRGHKLLTKTPQPQQLYIEFIYVAIGSITLIYILSQYYEGINS